MLGLIAGVIVFAEIYTAIAAFVWSGSLESATLAELLGLPFWLLAALVVVMALGTFWLVRRLELKAGRRSEEHTSELQSRLHLVCRLLLEKKNRNKHRGMSSW